MGLDVDAIILCQPDNGEMALEVVDQLVRSNAVDVIAIDSVAALVPRAEIEGEIGAVQGAPRARLLLEFCKGLTATEVQDGDGPRSRVRLAPCRVRPHP